MIFWRRVPVFEKKNGYKIEKKYQVVQKFECNFFFRIK